jgi:predicted ATPase
MKMHYKIGNNVLKKIDPKDLTAKIFYIVDQLNKGVSLITDFDERMNLLKLNHTAAVKAKNSASFAIAADYFETARLLLSSEEWASMPGEPILVH